MTVDVDVVVVGLGPGGEHVATELAKAGLVVAGVERRLVGGECPYWGCVPSKMMIRAATMIAETRRASGVAGDAHITPDWSLVAKRIRNEATDNWNDKVAVDRLENAGAQFFRGDAHLIDAHTVAVDDQRITARKGIVLATGTTPFVPAIEGLDAVPYWTNHEAVEVDDLPKSLIIMGGGAIGAELAQVFARFGVSVTMIESNDRVVSREEPEASTVVAAAFERDGIRILTDRRVDRVTGDSNAVTVHMGGQTETAEKLLVAVGRRVDLAGIKVGAIGVDETARAIPIDSLCRVTDGVWAIGDITGKGAFTHMSMYQAGIVINDILRRDPVPARYHAVPRVTFTDPEVGSVGITQVQAQSSLARVQVGVTALESSSRGWIHGPGGEGVIKVVADAERDVLVGATSVGPWGGETLSFLALAVQEAIPIANLRNMIYAYPTFYRAIEAAIADLHDV